MDNKITFYQKYPLVCLASVNSEILLFPIDHIKTKMQFTNNSFIKLSKQNINKHGFIGFYKGIIPSIGRHWTYSGLRIGLYEEIRDYLYANNFNDDDFLPKILASSISGGISQFIASPFDMVKMNAIVNPNNNRTIIKNIYNQYGFMGFYKGVYPNVARAICVNIGEIATYDFAKKQILVYRNVEDIYTFSIASFFSGFSSALLCTPADTIRTKIMTEKNTSKNINTLKFCSNIIKKDGIFILYTGFYANWFRLAPWQLIFWNSYEFYRSYFGYKNF